MTDVSRLPAGNILLYDYLRDKRNPTFLNRNLCQALRLHEQELNFGVPNQLEPKVRRHWTPPTVQMIREHNASKALLLQVRGIKSRSDDELEEHECDVSNEDGHKLLFRRDVRIRVDVWSPQTSKCCVTKEVDGTINGIRRKTKKVMTVELHNDFTLPLQDLLVPRNSDDPLSWKQSAAPAYQLRITLLFDCQLDVQVVLDHTPLQNSSLVSNPPTRLCTRTTSIKELTRNNHILPLTYDSKGQKSDLQLGLWVKIGWVVPTARSVIAAANLERQKVRRLLPSQLPWSGKQKHQVVFRHSGKSITYRGIKCCHCVKNGLGKSFLRITDLQLHLDCFHSLFKYQFQETEGPGGIQHWEILVFPAENKPEQRASDRAPDPREVQIIAPPRPFNQREYLEHGDDSWQREARCEKNSTSGPLVFKGYSSRRKDPNEVQFTRSVNKQKYRVPKAPPKVQFYRTFTKRPLVEGDIVSESEDDIDMDWLRLKTDSHIMNDASIPERAKRFLKVWNNYIRDERLQGDLHVGDALIRFARQKATWLKIEGLIGEFREEVHMLFGDRVISRRISEACLDIVGQAGSKPPSDAHDECKNGNLDRHQTVAGAQEGDANPARNFKGKGKARAIEGNMASKKQKTVGPGGDVPMQNADGVLAHSARTEPDSTPQFEKCICGHNVSIHSKRRAVFCGNDDCVRHIFHLDCVAERWKPRTLPDPLGETWFCRDCERDPAIDTGGRRWHG